MFDKHSAVRSKNLGLTAIHLILINTVIPFLFVYGKNRNDQGLVDRSLRLLDQLPGEVNTVVKKWETLGMSVRTAFNTQALIELKSNYCNHKKCLHCAIGNDLLKAGNTLTSVVLREDKKYLQTMYQLNWCLNFT